MDGEVNVWTGGHVWGVEMGLNVRTDWRKGNAHVITPALLVAEERHKGRPSATALNELDMVDAKPVPRRHKAFEMKSRDTILTCKRCRPVQMRLPCCRRLQNGSGIHTHLALLHETAELGAGHPGLLIITLATASATSTVTTATAAIPTATLAATVTKTTAEAATSSGCCWCWSVTHLQELVVTGHPMNQRLLC